MFYLLSASWYLSGDGGNDVSMIQAADCGIGIEGKVGLCFRLPCSRALSSLPAMALVNSKKLAAFSSLPSCACDALNFVRPSVLVTQAPHP